LIEEFVLVEPDQGSGADEGVRPTVSPRRKQLPTLA